MTQAEVSRSAVNMTLVRANLTSKGVVDDPYAHQMLPPRARQVDKALQLPGLRLLARSSTLPYLAARTRVVDRFVDDALDAGIRQVVLVGAGYDSRAWRMARDGVTFFEVDRPATQADKRTRAPDGGPVYVPADAGEPGIPERLVEAGLDPTAPVAVTMEGLVVYLPEQAVVDLLTGLADLVAAGSRLAVSFEQGFARRPLLRRIASRANKASGELFQFRLAAADAPAFLARTGWTVDEVLTGPGLTEHLRGTALSGPVRGASSIAVARRAES